MKFFELLSKILKKKHLYSESEKREQLLNLVSNIELQIEIMKRNNYKTEKVPEYKEVVKRAKHYLREGFTQSKLSLLAISVPSIIYLHKEWVPPLIETESKLSLPFWFKELEVVCGKVELIKLELRSLGDLD